MVNSFPPALAKFFATGDLLQCVLEADQGAPVQPTSSNGFGCHFLLQGLGILCIEPARQTSATQSIVISTGIHGNETAPIELLNDLIIDLVMGRLIPTQRLLLIMANPLAMVRGKRYVDTNLNRLFGPNSIKAQAGGLYETARVLSLQAAVSAFFKTGSARGERLHYDLHTAIRDSKYEKFAVYPYRHDQAWARSQLDFLNQCDVGTVLLAHKPSSTFSYYTSSTFDCHAFTLELGKARPFGQNHGLDLSALDSQLRLLITGQISSGQLSTGQSVDHSASRIFRVCAEIIRETKAFQLHLPAEVSNFTSFPPGTLIASDRQDYVTGQEQEFVVFPNADVELGQRAALMLVHGGLNISAPIPGEGEAADDDI